MKPSAILSQEELACLLDKASPISVGEKEPKKMNCPQCRCRVYPSAHDPSAPWADELWTCHKCGKRWSIIGWTENEWNYIEPEPTVINGNSGEEIDEGGKNG